MTVNDHDFPPLSFQSHVHHFKQRVKATKATGPGESTDSTTTLTSLPDELLLAIFEYLPSIDGRNSQLPTLIHISRTSHRLRRIVIEKIYATYDAEFCDPYLFLRTIISNPRLAKLVRHVDTTYGSSLHGRRARFVATAQDKKIIKEGMRKLSLPDWKAWATDCNEEDVDIEILHTAILMFTLNITSLIARDIAYVDPRRPKWNELMRKVTLGTNLGQVHKFQHLQSIRVDVVCLSLRRLAPLFRLQSLRQLDLRELVNGRTAESQTTTELQRLILPAGNNLEDLHLELKILRMEHLDVLLASPRRLKSFNYAITLEEWSYEMDVIEAVRTMNISTVLSHQKDSLKDLQISCDSEYEMQLCRAIKLYDILGDLTSLEHLRSPLNCLIDANSGESSTFDELLPVSLLTLRIDVQERTPKERLLRLLEQLAIEHSTRGSRLQKLRVNLPVCFDWQRSASDRYRELYLSAGIELVVVQEQEEPCTHACSDSSSSSDEVSLYSDRE